MLKLIKTDLYRLFTSNAVIIGAIFSAVVCLGYMLLSLGIVELARLAESEDPTIVEGLSFFLSQAAWIGGVDFAHVVLEASSVFSLFIGCMITANFIGSEQSAGYMKNYAGQLTNKGYIAISKFVSTSAAQVMILLIYTIVSGAFTMILFSGYITGYGVGTLFGALGIRLMLHLAINAIIIFVCMLTKSHAIAMVFGSIFGIGITKIAYMAISSLLSMMKIDFAISDYMPDGINSQLAFDTVSDLAVKGVLVSVAFVAVFVTLNFILIRKRDVK